jgi:hypothetical protein
MAFFDKGSSESLTVGKDIWLYPATAIPFTLLVILAWIAWRRRQFRWSLKAALSRLTLPLTEQKSQELEVDDRQLQTYSDKTLSDTNYCSPQVQRPKMFWTAGKHAAPGGSEAEGKEEPFPPIVNMTPCSRGPTCP